MIRTLASKKTIFILLLLFTPSLLIASEYNNKETKGSKSAIVIDYKLLGDTSLEEYHLKDAQLMKIATKSLTKKIDDLQNINIMDDPSAMAEIKSISESHVLHRCNGCVLKLNSAKKLGASYVIVPWVFRMSILIQTMYLEVRDVESGKVVVHMGRNFRGNTEEGWEHAMDSLVRDLDTELNEIES